jgi:hypothetical protein
VVGNCEYGKETSGSIKCGDFLTSYKPVSFSSRTLLHGEVSSLYLCESLSLTFRKEHRLRVFENRVLRRIFWA